MLTELQEEKQFHQQFLLGKQLRKLTDAMNTPCEPFNRIQVITDPDRSKRWKPYTKAFRDDRAAYLENRDFGQFVFTHGDLCADNILVKKNQGRDELVVIDFADSVLAPKCYEPSLLAFEYQAYPSFLQGYWEGEDLESVVSQVFNGILIHDFGGDIVKLAFPEATEFRQVKDLYERIVQIGTKIMRKK